MFTGAAQQSCWTWFSFVPARPPVNQRCFERIGRRFVAAEFWAESTTIADALYDAGIQRGDVVAVALPDGPELIASFVGASRVAACAPLNVALHVSELTAGRSYERKELACNVVQFLGADEVHSKGAACA